MEDVMGAPLTTPLARRDPLYAMTPLSLLQPASFFDEFFNLDPAVTP
jgi:hypothetical protein